VDYSRYARDHHILVEVKDQIALVTLNRPEKRNAVNYAMHSGLERIFRELGRDPQVGAIILTGAGNAFCAGGDMTGFNNPDARVIDQLRGNRDLMWEMTACEAPLVSAINGAATGLGATLALLCDVSFAAESARIGDTHVRMGLVAGDGGCVIWPLLVGPHIAKEYLMTGRLIDGPRAAQVGLVNHCVPDAQLLDAAREFARELVERPQPAQRWTKMAINKLIYQQLNTVGDFALTTELLSAGTEDQKEAVAAFFEKRKPRFTGM
jgi:enoyl-CoA hydratase